MSATLHIRSPSSKLGLDADSVIHRGLNSLFAANMEFCGLNCIVSQKKLDLFQFSDRNVAEPRARATEVVRRQLVQADRLCRFLHDVPHRLFRHAVSPPLANLIDPTKQFSA